MISDEAQIAKSKLEKEQVNHFANLADERAGWDEYASTLPIAQNVGVHREKIADIECLWIRPDKIFDDKLVIYAHGGGLVVGSLTTHRSFVSHLAKTIGRNILMVGYGLLPENDFSKPMQDISAVYLDLIAKGKFTPEKIYFSGDSSGAGAALSSLIDLREKACELPNGFIGISGAFDVSLKGESMHTKNDADPILSYAVLRHWQEQYFSGKIVLEHPHISPLFSQLHGLPDILLITGGDEVWLDDSLRLAKNIVKAGGNAELKVFDQMWHVFPMDTQLPESLLAMKHIKTFLNKC